MTQSPQPAQDILLLVAGLKGAIGSTLAVAIQALNHEPETVLPYLTTIPSGRLGQQS